MSKFLGMGRWCGRVLASVVVAGLMTACGGGGGDAGTSVVGGGGDGGGGTTTPTAADLVLVMSTATLPSDGSRTALVTATAVDSSRNVVKGVPVTIAVNSGAVAKPSGTVTDESGVVSAAVGIGSDSSNRTITITVTSKSITKTATLSVVDPTTASQGPTVSIDLSTSLVTAQVPVTATFTVRSTSGAALSNVLLNIATVRGGLATLSSDTALTDSTGVAKVTLKANITGLIGADELTASATIAGVQITARKGFSVAGASPTLALAADTTTLKTSSGAVSIRATVRDDKGTVVAGQLVRFSSVTSNVVLDSATGLTDSAGVARTTMSPKDGSVSAADTVQASTTYQGIDLFSSLGVQVVGEKPSIDISVSNSAISTTQTATVRALVKDVSGALVKDALVTFSSVTGLTTFDATTAKTDATGVAVVTARPTSQTSNGGDAVDAKVTLNGVTVTARQSVQVAASVASGNPTLQVALSGTSLSAATPATVTVTLLDARGTPVAGQVVTFSVLRGLAKTNIPTALTNASGVAVVQLSPTNTQSAGADEVVASAKYAGVDLQASKGFQIQATDVTINDLQSLANPLSAYGQTPITLTLSGATIESPVKITVTSACVALGKATLSPASFSTTTNTVTMQYRDNGCGAVQSADQLQAVIDGTATAKSLKLNIDAPAASSLAFIQASPEAIYLKGSGFVENSVITFEVRDAAGSPLPGRVVELRLQTGAGGVTMEGRGVESVDPPSVSPFVQTSNALGRVSVRVNSGTQPTPVRVHAKLQGTTISTVSSNLTIAVGLPSQLNFSLSQGTINIEGYDIDGTPNTYQIIAADRSGNPVPAGTTINFVTEGGQVEPSKQIQLASGLARTTANFVSSEPRPQDGRVTVVAYALGEESFLDLNGNNAYDVGEPYQDLGSIFKDRNFDGVYDSATDEFVSLMINNSSACTAPTSPLLAIDVSIPSRPGTCDGSWSGAGQVYVRRAAETIFSTSAARPLWPQSGTLGLTTVATTVSLRTTGNATPVSIFMPVSNGDVICRKAVESTFDILVADKNPVRFNPMAAGTLVTASTNTAGFSTQVVGGGTVPSASQASTATISYKFDTASEALLTLAFRSPSGQTTAIPLVIKTSPSCP